MVETTPAITLTNQEQILFKTLTDFCQECNHTTTLRVAGGWVRDKMLGLESDDVDIALDNMNGEAFAQSLVEHMIQKGKQEGLSEQQLSQYKFNVVKANSEKSKHLETATLVLQGQAIDFVNLRCESYTEQSRVPVMEIGTPEQDAKRRDLTFNSLFYNINTCQIEDFTGQGISDLKNRIVRTPLEPLQTFLDDPLRILRAIRFANKYQCEIVPDILEAAKNQQVRDALEKKVSVERAGTEIEKIFASQHPSNGMKLLHNFNVLPLLFKIPENVKELQDDQLIQDLIEQSCQYGQKVGPIFMERQKSRAMLFGNIPVMKEKSAFHGGNEIDERKTCQMSSMYAALLEPFYQYQMEFGKKKEVISVVQYILEKSLRRPTALQKFVLATCKHASSCVEYANSDLVALKEQEDKRLVFGQYLREAKHFWPSVELIAYAKDAVANPETDPVEIWQKYKDLNKVIQDCQLEQIHEVKHLVNGTQLCQEYNVPKGKILKPLLDEVMNFQIVQPTATEEDVLSYMIAHKETILAKYS